MRTLSFASREALEIAITSALIPAEIAARPASVWQEDGALRLRPRRKLPAAVIAGLVQAGVEGDDARAPGDARAVSCFAEALLPRRVGEPEGPLGRVLLRVEPGRGWLDVAAELLRLGCDRMSYRATAAGVLLLVDAPPYYTVARAVDGEGSLRAHAEQAGDVWVELGHAHPLARLQRPEGLLLIDREGTWTLLPEGPWAPIDALLSVKLATKRSAVIAPPPGRLEVPLRLVQSGLFRAPSLWILSAKAPWDQLERLLCDLPEIAQRGLAFAVVTEGTEAGGTRERVLLRARPGHTLAELSLDAERYASHPALPNLYLPQDASLEPPLGVDKLRALSGADADRLVWLAADVGGVVATTLPEEAFRPLPAWVDYLLHRHADAIAPWIGSATFDLGVLTIERSAAPSVSPEPIPEVLLDLADEPPTKTARRPSRRPTKPKAREVGRPPAISTDDARLAALEEACLAADPEGRLAAWEALAEAYAAIGRHRDAAHGWLRVVWERDDPEIWRRWREALGPLAQGALADLDGRFSADALLAVVCALGNGEAVALEALTALADRQAQDLDLRSRWLLARQLADRSGGDLLRLTRTRDALLGELRAGLSLDRDVPAFLRARAAGLGNAAEVAALAASLEALREAVEHGERERSATEAPPEATAAYALRLLAWAEARLGRRAEAEALRAEAATRLEASDEVHVILTRMLDARIQHALEGLAPTAPLPSELMGELDALAAFTRYKVDRLREASRILEPVERLDAVQAFRRAEADPRGDAFAGLRGLLDPAAVAAQIAVILRRAFEAEAEERGRLFDGAMDFFYALPVSEATSWLEQLVERLDDVPAFHRALLLEEALGLAGHFGHDRLVAQLSDRLEQLVGELGLEQSAALARVLRGTLRTLRRVGLRERASRLLASVARHTEGEGPALAIARLHLAGGLAFLGDAAAATSLIDAEIDALAADHPIRERMDRIRAIADATATLAVPERRARAERLLEELPRITDSFSTNSHFCLSLIHVTESVVHALVPFERDRSGPAAALLDEDEHLVRRRIHADVRRAT
ncbi:MAG: hypothetical protein R3B72_06720 [Polyangiaceae bacterium]